MRRSRPVATLALAIVLVAATRGAAAATGYPPIAGKRQAALYFHVVGSGGHDPYNPGLQTDYMAFEIPSDGGHYLAKEGDDEWFTWSVLLPEGFPTQRGWGVIDAWKSVGVGFNSLANIRLDITDDVLRLYTSGGNPNVIRNADGSLDFRADPRYGPRYEQTFTLGSVPRGVWQTFYFHVRWSQTQGGLVELYRAIDGGMPRRLLAPHAASTLYDDWPAVRYPIQDLYHKGGQANLGTVSDVYQTPMQWAPTLQAALSSPSAQLDQGHFFGDTTSSGSIVPASSLPVPLPARVLLPQTTPAPATTTSPAPSGDATASAPAGGRGVQVDPGCGTCRVRISSSGIAASIQGGNDQEDTAVWTRQVPKGKPLTVTDRIRLRSATPLDANLAVLQLRGRAGLVLWEIYVAPDRSLHLWSPPGALEKAAVNRPLGVLVSSARPVALTAALKPRRSLVVRVGSTAVVRLPHVLPASGNAVSLRVGIDHYDGSPGNHIAVQHSGLHVTTP